jgi:DNA-binding CsgD family transcriptional regulator/PAS domain-containing protein
VSSETSVGELLDFVYDAALAPELWPLIVERLSDMIGGVGGMLVDQNPQTGEGDAIIVGHEPSVLASYFGYYASRNVLLRTPDARRYLRQWTPRILTDEEWLPKETLVRSEYYNDFLRPIDVHSVLMIRLAAYDLNTINLNIGRPERHGQFSAGEIDLVTQVHPHLIRSLRLGQKLSVIRRVDAGAAELLDRSPHAVFLVDQDSRVRHANPAAERLVADGDGITLFGGRLGSAATEASQRLRALIQQACEAELGHRRGGAMIIQTPGRRLPLSVIVAPVSADRPALLQGDPLIIVCVTDPQAGVVLPQQQLRDLFGLTAAEARVALALVEGESPREAAAKLGVSFYTVRAHLVRIFDKTQTKRQSELVALILRTIGVAFR